MKTKILIPGALLALFCATAQAQIPMVESPSNQPPVLGFYDQYFLTTNSAIKTTTSFGDDADSYFAHDRVSKGQTFTTGSAPFGYTLNSIAIQHIFFSTGNGGTYGNFPNGSSVSFRFGRISGTTLTPLLTTNATYSGPGLTDGGDIGTGDFFTFNLLGAGIGTLLPNTTYFFELAPTINPEYFEMMNRINSTTNTTYTNGTSFKGDDIALLDADLNVNLTAGEFVFDANLTAVGQPTVVATVNPFSAAPGGSFKITATITPGVGTVTNVSVDLSGIAGSSAATLVRSNTANVYTNTFTVPNASPLGTNILTVMAIQNTQPLVGIARVAFAVFSASAPVVVSDVTPAGGATLYVGEGILFSAAFSGLPPISYQWQTSPDGFSYTDISGATNTTYTIPAVALTNAGYYQLQASNQFGTTLAYGGSSLIYLIVNTGPPFPTYLWSAPISFSTLNADQILTNFPGTKVAGALVAKNGGNPIIVTNSSTDSPIQFAGSGAWATLSGGSGYSTTASINTNLTGNANFNTCLGDAYNGNAIHTITMSGLVLGQQYQVQLFSLDDRTGLNPLGSARLVNYQDPNNINDKSQNTAMSDNVYTLATFTATNTTMAIQQNIPNSSGNFNCLVLRAVGWNPPPYFTSKPADVNGFLGTSSSLSGSAAGDPTVPSPAITYQWQAGPTNGPFTNLVAGNKYAFTTSPTNSTLTISNLTASDGVPVYVLIATDGGGSTTSSVALVHVQAAPVPPAPGSYGAYALSNNPIGYWHLNETNDPSTGLLQAYDFSGNGNNGTYQAGAQNGFNGIMGPTNYPGFAANQGALFVNGVSSDVVSIPALKTPVTGYNATIALWIKPTIVNSTFRGIFYDRNSDTYGMNFGPSTVNGLNVLGYTWNNNQGDTYNYNSGLTMPLNTWQFAVVVIQSNMATLYLDYLNNNGVPVLQSAVNHTTDTASLIESFQTGITAIGGDPGNNNTITAYIADVALYNTNLSSDQVLQMFGAAAGVLHGFAPAISVQPPTNTTTYPGFTIQLSVADGGNLPITNQWKFNGTNLVDGIYQGALINGSTSNVLTIYGVTTNNAGLYNLVLSNSVGSTVSSNALLTIVNTVPAPAANLVGAWFTGAANLTDTSGYSPAGTHDGYGVTGAGVAATNYAFTTDVPQGASGQSLTLGGSTAIAIANSSTNTDLGHASTYTNTYDNVISNSFTVTCWAKGNLGAWNAFVTKGGDFGTGWALREGGGGGIACWTVRGSGGTEDMQGPNLGNDQQWHFYAGTYSALTGIRSLYVDGVLQGQYTGQTAYADSMGHLTFGTEDRTPGNNYGNNGYYNGKLYGVRIYNVALTDPQQASLFIPPPLPKPAFSVKPAVTTGPSGKQIVLTWSYGTLLQATNIAGPWTTNSATPPYTNILNTSVPNLFFKLSYP